MKLVLVTVSQSRDERVWFIICITCVCGGGGGGGGCRGKNKNRRGRIVVAGGEAGREGMCNVYKTIDVGVKSI